MKKIIRCCYCDAILSKDEIGATKKYIHREIKQFMCYSCLSDFVECTVDELVCEIERFKEEGCGLFK